MKDEDVELYSTELDSMDDGWQCAIDVLTVLIIITMVVFTAMVGSLLL